MELRIRMVFLPQVLQQEINPGFKIQGSPEDRCCCFKRKTCDLEYNLSSKQASKCFGIHLVKTEVNERKYEAHQNIIEILKIPSIHAQVCLPSLWFIHLCPGCWGFLFTMF